MRNSQIILDRNGVLFAFTLMIALIAAWYLKGVIALFFLAFILYAGLKKPVAKLTKAGLPRGLAIALLYTLIFGTIVLGVVLIANRFAEQIGNLAASLPTIINNIVAALKAQFPSVGPTIEPLSQSATQLSAGQFREQIVKFLSGSLSSEGVINFVSSAFGISGKVLDVFISGFAVFMIAAYMLGRGERIYDGIDYFFAGKLTPSREKTLQTLLSQAELRVGAWVNGQLSLMLIIGIATYAIVVVPSFFFPDYKLHEFALPLALLAALLEAVPSIGPLITFVFAGVLALGTSGTVAFLYIAVAFLALQNVESVFIVPQVMKQAVGFDPIITILSIIAGFQLAGVLGAILIIPFLTIIKIGFDFWRESRL